jgi:tetratricopeptide (TPR) repeat protein
LAEQSFRTALELNEANPLVWLTFALFLRESNRFQDSLVLVDQMVERQIMAEQALLLRAEIWEVCGEHDRAVDQYVELLQTPYARAAAERLYGVLQDVGRHNDAAVIFKKYLHKSCH